MLPPSQMDRDEPEPPTRPARGVWRTRLKWIGIILLSGTILLALTYVLFPQVFIVTWVKLKFPRAEAPDLYRLPVERNLEGANFPEARLRTFERNGIRFTTPWGEPLQERQVGQATALGFEREISLMLTAQAQPLTESWRMLSDDEAGDREKLQALFGEDIFQSDYTLIHRMLNTSPEQLSIFSPKEQAIASSILLLLKAMGTTTQDGNIYSFSTSWMKGFQHGKPGDTDRIFVQLFDRDDRPMEMLFRGDITLPEFDFVLASVQPTRSGSQ